MNWSLEKEFEVYIDENLFNHLNGEDIQTKAENYLTSENVGIYFDIEYLNESELDVVHYCEKVYDYKIISIDKLNEHITQLGIKL